MIPERDYQFLQFRRDAERYNADALSVEDMTQEELVRAARLWGIDPERFTI